MPLVINASRLRADHQRWSWSQSYILPLNGRQVWYSHTQLYVYMYITCTYTHVYKLALIKTSKDRRKLFIHKFTNRRKQIHNETHTQKRAPNFDSYEKVWRKRSLFALFRSTWKAVHFVSLFVSITFFVTYFMSLNVWITAYNVQYIFEVGYACFAWIRYICHVRALCVRFPYHPTHQRFFLV